jgi:hypothetical protein
VAWFILGYAWQAVAALQRCTSRAAPSASRSGICRLLFGALLLDHYVSRFKVPPDFALQTRRRLLLGGPRRWRCWGSARARWGSRNTDITGADYARELALPDHIRQGPARWPISRAR